MLKFLVFVNSCVAVVTILSYLSGFVSPDTSGYIALLGLLFPYLLIINLFLICFWLLVDWKKSFISIITLLIGWSHLFSFFGIGNMPSSQSEGKAITITSFNINHGYLLDDKTRPHFESKVYTKDVDVFCFQEFNFRTNKYIQSLSEEYQRIGFKKNSVSILTKLPVLNSGELGFTRGWKSCVYADLKIDDQIVRVYNVHLYSNKLTSKTEEMIEEKNFNNEETVEDVKYIFGSYINSSKIRVKEIQILKNHIEKCPHPVILTGDFNDTPHSYIYSELKNAGLYDAFNKVGKGLGYTYGGSLPLLRIDFTFADDDFEMISHNIFRKKMSDHYPIKSTLVLKEN